MKDENGCTGIFDMDLHEVIVLDKERELMRVPGGWIYTMWIGTAGCGSIYNHIFVPYSNEFSAESLIR